MINQKEEKFAGEIIKSFRLNDAGRWVSLFPTNEEYSEILQQMLKNKMEGLTQQKINDMIARRKKEATTVYTNEFIDFQKQAKDAGVEWDKTLFEKFSFTSIFSGGLSRKYLNGDIFLSLRNIRFIIEGIEAVETASGYKLQSIKSIRKYEETW